MPETIDILVIDDNAANRYFLTRVLTQAGFRVRVAATGAEGLALAEHADLITLDVRLPDISGFEVCRRLRENRATADIPVMHISASFTRPEAKAEGLEGGADAYLTHPVEPLELVATVRALLRARAAERSLARYKLFSEHTGDVVLMLRRDGTIVEANEAAARAYGFTRDELVNRSVTELRVAGADEVARVRLAETNEHGTIYDSVHRRRDGSEMPVEVSMRSSIIDGRELVLCVIRDVSERHRTDALVRAHAERQTLLSRAVAVLLLPTDAPTTAQRLFEMVRGPLALDVYFMYRPTDDHALALEAWSGVDHADVAEQARVEVGETMCGAAAQRLERVVAEDIQSSTAPSYAFLKSIGVDAHVVTPLVADGRLLGTLGFGRRTRRAFSSDELEFLATICTYVALGKERGRSEGLLRDAQRLESIGVLAGGVAHDFNNLLTGIVGYATLAQGTIEPDHSATMMLGEILKASQRAADLTAQLLAYAGKGRFHVRPLDFGRLVRDLGGLLRSMIDKQIELRVNVPDGLPLVEADAGQFQQIVMNLVMNAAEAIGDASGRIDIDVSTASPTPEELALRFPSSELRGERFVFFTVRDSGVGIEPHVRARIFEPFFTTKFTGRGLGLAAVLGIVRGHRGAIAVDSVPGHGATFTVVLPASGSQPVAAAVPKAAAAGGRGRTVLIVEDEDMVRRMTWRALDFAGFRVLEASNGVDGVEVFSEHQQEIALVLLDMVMPRMSGDEAARKIREINAQVPILATSGYGEIEAMRRFRESGMNGFLPKPFRPDQLVAKVEEILAQTEAPSRT